MRGNSNKYQAQEICFKHEVEIQFYYQGRSGMWVYKRSVKPIGHVVPMGCKRLFLHLHFVNLNNNIVLSKINCIFVLC